MSTLGPGQRVYIGWCPDSQMGITTVENPRCRTGTIMGGPFPKGAWFRSNAGKYYRGGDVMWRVKPDHCPAFIVAESLLSPIDGDDLAVETTEADEVTA